MILLLFIAFLSGFATILAPCIWPLLPIVLSSAVNGHSHRRPLGITLGIMLSFAIFTLAISYLVGFFHLDPNILRLFAVIVITFLGVSLIIPSFNRLVEIGISRLTGIWGNRVQKKENDFSNGFVTGVSLGIVWSPCAGPILAAIATLAATGQVSLSVIFVTVAYVLGLGIPLFIFAYGGQKIFRKTRFMNAYLGRTQQLFGVIMILTAIAIFTNYDKVLQVKLLDTFPLLGQSLTQFETTPAVKEQLDILIGKKVNQQTVDETGLFNAQYPAPEFSGITKWLNTDKPLTMLSLRGKVVLIDFWTYTCINCIRTLPHVTAWYNTYKDQGFVVIGVHTPEFAFEKETKNVIQAISQYKIHYPVAQDNNYATWNVFNNQYWPAEYLIDANGMVRRTHFGEGEYVETEKAIQALLKNAGQKVTNKTLSMPDETPTETISPETYLGSRRMEYFYPDGKLYNGTKTYTLNNQTPLNAFSFGGSWKLTDDYAIALENATLLYHFTADKVHLVMLPPQGSIGKVRIYLDNKLISKEFAGEDVNNGIVTLTRENLYTLVNLHGLSGEHTLRLEFLTPRAQLFAFTFS